LGGGSATIWPRAQMTLDRLDIVRTNHVTFIAEDIEMALGNSHGLQRVPFFPCSMG